MFNPDSPAFPGTYYKAVEKLKDLFPVFFRNQNNFTLEIDLETQVSRGRCGQHPLVLIYFNAQPLRLVLSN